MRYSGKYKAIINNNWKKISSVETEEITRLKK